MNTWSTVRIFVAFYLLLFGIGFMSNAPEVRAMIGAFFAAAALTFFWRLWIAVLTRE